MVINLFVTNRTIIPAFCCLYCFDARRLTRRVLHTPSHRTIKQNNKRERMKKILFSGMAALLLFGCK
jgi:hypothetical protein